MILIFPLDTYSPNKVSQFSSYSNVTLLSYSVSENWRSFPPSVRIKALCVVAHVRFTIIHRLVTTDLLKLVFACVDVFYFYENVESSNKSNN